MSGKWRACWAVLAVTVVCGCAAQVVGAVDQGRLDEDLLRAAKNLDAGRVHSSLSMGANPAAKSGNFEGSVLQRLMSALMRRNLTRSYGKSPPLVLAAGAQGGERAREDIVRALMAAGSDVRARDADGNTPLIVACKASHFSAARILLTARQDVNAANASGATALDFVDLPGCYLGDDGVLQMLESRGARHGTAKWRVTR